MASSMATKVISGYRRLFRARKILFAGDHRAMAQSRVAIRAEFLKNADVIDHGQLEGFLTMIDEAEDMLLHGFARGELNEKTGHYEVKVKPEHTNVDTMTTMEPIINDLTEEDKGPKTVVVTSTYHADKNKNEAN